MSDCLKANGDTLREHNVLSFFLDNTEKKFVDLSRNKVACENIRFSSLFAVGGVSSVRNVPSGEERGETDVFAGWKQRLFTIYMGKPVGPRFRQMVRKIQDW